MNYAIKDKGNRCTGIVDAAWKSYLIDRKLAKEEDFVEVSSAGSASFSCEEGSITAISIQPVNTTLSRDSLFMITRKPDTMNLKTAYEVIGL